MGGEQDCAALQRELDRQRKLVSASYALHTTLDLDELLNRILNVAAEGVDAERGTVFLMSDEGKEIWSRVMWGGERLEIRLPLGKGIAGSVAMTGQNVRIDDAYKDPRFDPSWDKKSGFHTRQILCAPIRNREGAIVGVFQLLNKRGTVFTPQDEEYLAALSIHAALAIENARLHRSAIERERQEREITLARKVQRQLQPERADTKAGGISVAGMNELCEDASGDYYDFLVPLPNDRLGVAIGDVSGHGLQAAIVMAEARAFLRAFVRTTPELTKAMDLLNDFLVPDMSGGKFMSLFSAVIDTKSGRVEWCNAGHNPPLLYRAAKRDITLLRATGRILGVLPSASYRAGAGFTMEPGDTLLLYTDGVTEARSPTGELYGDARLAELLAASAAGTPVELLTTIKLAVAAWTGRATHDDDVTLLAAQRM